MTCPPRFGKPKSDSYMERIPQNTPERDSYKEKTSTPTSLQPLFRMVSRNTIKKDILSIYEKEREKSKHEIDKNQGRISITIDMWTSQNKKRGFMVVTTHFIDGLWRLQSRVMRYFF